MVFRLTLHLYPVHTSSTLIRHRNTFLNSPKLLDNSYRLKKNPNIFFAGQITGVEGYVESAASGLAVGIYLSQIIEKGVCDVFSRKTAMGALSRYVSDETVVNFQPMNINFGIIDPLEYRVKGKKEKNTAISMRALQEIDRWKEENKW